MTTDYRKQIQDAAKRRDFAEFTRLEEEYEAEIRAAIQRGIEKRDTEHGPLTDLEREAVHTAVDRIVSWDSDGVADPVVFAETWATRIAGDPLMVKLELAYNLEMDLTDGHIVIGGMLGSALDDAIERLLPYAEHSGGWYQAATNRADS